MKSFSRISSRADLAEEELKTMKESPDNWGSTEWKDKL